MEFFNALDEFIHSPLDELLDIEVWKIISDYPGYSVSTRGRVKRVRDGLIMSQRIRSGYYVIDLYKNTKRKTFRVHRLVAQCFIPNPDNKPNVDHINCIPTDNRLSNLRWCTQRENSYNSKTPKNNTSGFKGVIFRKDVQKYQSRIIIDGKTKHLGYFQTAEDAAKKYNETALEYFKEFARLNEIK